MYIEFFCFPDVAEAFSDTSPLRTGQAMDERDAPNEWLTARELQVLQSVALGLSAKEIAKKLLIAPRTVERHIDHIRLKTRTRNRSHMVAFALTNGVIGT
ncbi:response regulator transcription factor [Sphingomonas kyeonggiensis]|uniref:DNA-binding CsgD family transcriptional regulator n=2 Tax=Sphingomonas TaxID=13687 RepID=A0A7W6NZ83_9SPHN|nr:helix-turn-helix transcriptional regulator [Sphingomonas kyeonggiensis]MBB4101467.1 DNA-binding CsgD family transcriptional regulator [Sphingomonas kyeonggiensis]